MRNSDTTATSRKNIALSKFLALFVPFWFLSNLASAVTEFGVGLQNVHSYFLALILFGILFIQNGAKRFTITTETVRLALAWGIFLFICLCSVLLDNGSQQSMDQFIAYTWMGLLSIGLAYTFRHTETMRYLFWSVFCAVILLGVVNIAEL